MRKFNSPATGSPGLPPHRRPLAPRGRTRCPRHGSRRRWSAPAALSGASGASALLDRVKARRLPDGALCPLCRRAPALVRSEPAMRRDGGSLRASVRIVKSEGAAGSPAAGASSIPRADRSVQSGVPRKLRELARFAMVVPLGKWGILMGLRVLVVEDEALVALNLVCLLEDLGHFVVGPVASSTQALALAGENPVDVAFVDLNLADGQTGASVALALGANPGRLSSWYPRHQLASAKAKAGFSG